MAQQEIHNTDFLIGQLTGAVTSLTNQVASMQGTILGLDQRLRSNEQSTNALTVKMAMLGTGAGAIGSFAMTIIQQYLFR